MEAPRSFPMMSPGPTPLLRRQISLSDLLTSDSSAAAPVPVPVAQETPLHHAARAADVKSVATLAGAEPSLVGAPNERGTTPLMLAAALDEEGAAAATLQALLAAVPGGPLRAAVLEARDANGFTALHWAAALAEGPATRVAVLMEAGANPWQQCDRLGETPVHRAARFGRAAALAHIAAGVSKQALTPTALRTLFSLQNRWFQAPWDVAGHMSDPSSSSPVGGVLVPNSGRLLDKDKRRVALEALAAADPSLRVGVYYHPDCLEHITYSRDASVEHQEAPERLVAIMKRVNDAALFTGAEIATTSEFPLANEAQVLRAHSLEYVTLVVALDRHVRKQATAVPFTPLVARVLQQRGPARLLPAPGAPGNGGAGSKDSTSRSNSSAEVEEGPGFPVPPPPAAAPAAAPIAFPTQSESGDVSSGGSVVSRVAELGRPGTSDTTFSPGSLPAALRGAGAVCAAVDAVVAGASRHAFCAIRPPGHHAGYQGLLRDFASTQTCGFCIFNSVAIGALHALDTHRGAVRRVAILDIDVHSGNGTEEIVKRWSDANRGKTDQSLFFFSTHLYDVERVRGGGARGGEEAGAGEGGAAAGGGSGTSTGAASPPRRVTRSRNGVTAPRASNPDELTGDAAVAAAVAGTAGGGGTAATGTAAGTRRGRSSKGGAEAAGAPAEAAPPAPAPAPAAPPAAAPAPASAAPPAPAPAPAAPPAAAPAPASDGEADAKPPAAKRARLAGAAAGALAPAAPRSILKRSGAGTSRVAAAAAPAEAAAPDPAAPAAPEAQHKPVLLRLNGRAGAAGAAADAEAAATAAAAPEASVLPAAPAASLSTSSVLPGLPPLVRSVSFSEDSARGLEDVPRPLLAINTDEVPGPGVPEGTSGLRSSRRLLAAAARKGPLRLRLAGAAAAASATTAGGHITPPPRLLSRRTLGGPVGTNLTEGGDDDEDEDSTDGSEESEGLGLELAEHVFEGGISVTSRKSLEPSSALRGSGEGFPFAHGLASASRVGATAAASPHFNAAFAVERGTPAAMPPPAHAHAHCHSHSSGGACTPAPAGAAPPASAAIAGRLFVSGQDAISRVDASVYNLQASPKLEPGSAGADAAGAAAPPPVARPNAADAGGFAGSSWAASPSEEGGDSTIVYSFYPGTGAEDRMENNILNAPVQPLWRERRETKNTTRDFKRAKSGRFAVRRLILERLIPALRAFSPDLILISAGFDGGAGDVGNSRGALEGLNLTEADFRWITAQVLGVARVCCPGRVVSVLEGGYGKFKMVAANGKGGGGGGGGGGAGSGSGEGGADTSPSGVPPPASSASSSSTGPRWYLDRNPFADNVAAHLRGLVDDGGAVLPPTQGLSSQGDSDSDPE